MVWVDNLSYYYTRPTTSGVKTCKQYCKAEWFINSSLSCTTCYHTIVYRVIHVPFVLPLWRWNFMSLYTSLPECSINFLQHVGYNSESDVLLMLFLPAIKYSHYFKWWLFHWDTCFYGQYHNKTNRKRMHVMFLHIREYSIQCWCTPIQLVFTPFTTQLRIPLK